MKVAVCLLLCLFALQVDFSNGRRDRFDRFGQGAGRGNRCRSHHGRNHFSRHRHHDCEDDQGGNINEVGTGEVYNGQNNFGNVETSSPSTGGLRPGYNRNGNVEPYLPTGGRRPQLDRNGYAESSTLSTGGRRPEYNGNGNVENSSPSTGLRGPDNNANGTVVPVPVDGGKRLIQVGSNCPEGYRGDSRGNCREDF